ncbi:efflux RND transporter permease subunit [Pseudoalteromonas rubra]|uniref:efflux RND transporter permease subunit n=1 Tax=Pseudoalteromonas rubra TaxID=43658 RepID=UPI0023E87262|nr:efflux RND transporter permease subunit [Pseudoalteromonas rubra]
MLSSYLYSRTLLFVTCVSIFLFGLIGAYKNKVQLLPDVEPPRISFSVKWPNASEAFLLANIVEPYEKVLNSKLNTLETIKVTFSDESVRFEVQFEYGTNLETTEQKMRTLLSGVRAFPTYVAPLRFHQGGNNVSNQVVGSYFFTSENGQFTQAQTQLIKDIAKKQLVSISGVEKAELFPNLEQRVVIRLKPEQLTAFGLTLGDVQSRVRTLLQDSTGTFEQDAYLYTASYQSVDSISSLQNATLATKLGTVIRLNQIANVSVEATPSKWMTRFNGQSGILVRVLRQKQADLLTIQNAVDEQLALNTTALDVVALNYEITFDTGLFIKRAVWMMVEAISLGFALSLLVSFIFFRRVIPTLLSSLITLLSIMGVLGVLYLFDVSINVISLAGITFAIGMFVDGVLILIEYLDRQPHALKQSPQAIFNAISTMIPALLASTVTSVVVFLPIIFSEGAEGQLFSGLSLAFVSGLLISLALTILIVPVFVHAFMSGEAGQKGRSFVAGKLTHLVLNNMPARLAVIVVSTVVFLSSAIMLLPSLGYLPDIKRDAIDVYIPLKNTESKEKVKEELVEPLNRLIPQLVDGDIKNYYVISLGRLVTVGLRLEDNEQLPQTLAKLKAELPDAFANYNVITIHGNLFGGIEAKNNLKIYLHAHDKQWLAANQDNIKALFNNHLSGVSLRFKPDLTAQKSVYKIIPKFDNASFIGVSEVELKQLFKSLTQSNYLETWSMNGEAINVYMTLGEGQSLSEYANVPYVTQAGRQTYIGELLAFEQTQVIPSQVRFNSSYAIELNIGITDKALSVSDVMSQIEQHIAPELTALFGDKGRFELEGSAASITKAKQALSGMFLFVALSLFAIVTFTLKNYKAGLYVLASLITPLLGGVIAIILLEVMTGIRLDVLSVIGFIIMLGTVANNSILLVDTAARLAESGLAQSQAILQAIAQRKRAVLISSLTTIAGMVPLLLFPSEAGQLYKGIAAIIIGGMAFNLLSIFTVVPAFMAQFGCSSNKSPEIEQQEKHQNEYQGAA